MHIWRNRWPQITVAIAISPFIHYSQPLNYLCPDDVDSNWDYDDDYYDDCNGEDDDNLVIPHEEE